MTERTERLIESLRDELKEYGELLAILDRQQDFVVRRAAEDVLRTASAVEAQGAVILETRATRSSRQQDLARDLVLPREATMSEITERLPEKYRLLARALVGENNHLLFRVQQRARQNHVLLACSIDLLQRFINSLLPAKPTTVYREDGGLLATAPAVSAIYEAMG